jgi:chromosome segregation ATPase
MATLDQEIKVLMNQISIAEDEITALKKQVESYSSQLRQEEVRLANLQTEFTKLVVHRLDRHTLTNAFPGQR